MHSMFSLLAYFVVAAGLVGSLLAAAALLRVRATTTSRLKTTTYECGESPTGMAWVRFHARYYVVALFFVLFDIEAAFLFPWASLARELGPAGFASILSFVVVLMVGWFWAMRKGALQWQ